MYSLGPKDQKLKHRTLFGNEVRNRNVFFDSQRFHFRARSNWANFPLPLRLLCYAPKTFPIETFELTAKNSHKAILIRHLPD